MRRLDHYQKGGFNRALVAAALFIAPAGAFAAPPASDDFNGCTVLTTLWTPVDPLGDCTIDVIGAGTGNAQLRFIVPAGVEHDAWTTGNHVPRAVQTVDNTNFSVQIKIDSSLTQPYQGVGIMALESPTRFIRCEMHRGPGGPQFFVASVVDGSAIVHHIGAGLGTAPFWVRLSRSGNNWTPSYSTNGTTFTSVASFNRTLNISQLGPYALTAENGGVSPAFTALVDYFFNTASPILDEDAGEPGEAIGTLTVNTTGPGTVAIDPPGPDYACGELVTLTALPGPGGGFVGWSGDFSSQQNPLLFAMAGDTTLLATFTTDNTPPQITCPPLLVAEAGSLPVPSFAGGSATDNFDPNPVLSFTDEIVPGQGCPEVWRINRTWTATDDAGNSASCVQLIIVEDHTPPAFNNLPSNLAADCNDVPLPPVVSATDAGDPSIDVTLSEFTFPGDCPGRYTIQRSWTASDACGNSAQATRLVTVTDTTPPSITLIPLPAIASCNNIPPALPPTVADDCDPQPQILLQETTSAGNCATGYTLTRTWSATDACGNVSYASQSIQLFDNAPPILTLPPDITISCSESTDPSATGFATASDDDDPNPIITYDDEPLDQHGSDCPPGGSIARTWTATDVAGNSSEGVQKITILDTTAPEIAGIPPGEIEAECGSIPPPPTPTISDNCDPTPALEYAEAFVGTCMDGLVLVRTWTARDVCGNVATATQTVRLQDTTPPVMQVPPALVLTCIPNETASSAPTAEGAGSPTATDNCDPDVEFMHYDVTNPGEPGSNVSLYIKRTWIAFDHCNNRTMGVQRITISDHAPPTILQCPPDRTLSIEALTGSRKRTAPLPDFTSELLASDMCSDGITVTQTPAPGTRLSAGTHSIKFQVVDDFGNRITCRMTLRLVPFLDEDLCPDDPNKTKPGFCGCGVPETDSDDDGVPDCIDQCPDDPAKSQPGDCGCGVPDSDSDGDGVPDCLDQCPADPHSITPGPCGCGVADSDSDGTYDCFDECPHDPTKTTLGACGCGVPDLDLNSNSTPDCLEICPTSGDCFASHASPGCSSSECCASICLIDPYCCNSAWDQVCASQALIVCEQRPGNECQNALTIQGGAALAGTLLDNSGATGDDTTGPDCGSISDTIDEWYSYTADVNGIATATTCSPLTDFDTTLAVYSSCDGAQIACAAADAQCIFGSTVTWDVQFGLTYMIRVSAVDDEVGGFELIVDAEADDVPSEILNITFWYGQNQSFGHVGQPQRQVNLLGNVHSIHGVESLSYKLNGGPELPLSIGPDLRRLYHPGDFNVELFYEDLPAGQNQCIVRAADVRGNVIERAINFSVTHGNVAPLPYSIDWSEASSIHEVAQVVDGKWTITPQGVRILEQGYDRLIAVGDISWTDYEVSVPITIHAIDPNGYLRPSNTPGLGLILRWEGHTDLLEPGSQPMVGYWPLGCAAEYVFHLDQCGYRKQLYGNPFVLRDQDDTCEQLEFGVTYMWKVRVDTQANGTHFYGMKVWEQGTPEPFLWDLSMTELPQQPDNGCLLLFSHHVDVTYGDVEVVPVP